MSKIKIMPVILLIFTFGLLFVACARISTTTGEKNVPFTDRVIQSNEGGSVTIDVRWVGVENDFLAFNVAMNTHSVDLGSYDLAQLATLKDSGGNEYSPSSWETSSGGHHVNGTLYFRVPETIRTNTAEYVHLIIRHVAEIDERIFKWDLN